MSKTLEELLLNANELNESAKKLVKENKKSVIKDTMEDAVRNFITEAIEGDELEGEEDEDMDFDETDVDVDTGQEISATDAEDGMGDEEPDMDDAEEEMPVDVSVGMDDAGAQDEVMDLTNASEEEVLNVLNNMPDGAEVEIVKSATFNVNVDQAEQTPDVDVDLPDMGDQAPEMDNDNSDIDLDEMIDEALSEMDGSDNVDEGDYMDEAENLDEMIEEAMNEMDDEDSVEINESENAPYDNTVEVNQSKGSDNAPFDKKAKKATNQMKESELKKAYAKLVKENKRLRDNEQKAIKQIKESYQMVQQLAATNSKLAYTTRLFTEHSTTKKEKVQILNKLDKAKTVNEAKLMFEMLTENLSKRVIKNKPKININEIKDESGKQVIKEETYNKLKNVDPQHARVMQLMNHKPKR